MSGGCIGSLPTEPDAARRAAGPIGAGMQILRDEPGVGRPVEDMEPEFREWLNCLPVTADMCRFMVCDSSTAVVLAVRPISGKLVTRPPPIRKISPGKLPQPLAPDLPD